MLRPLRCVLACLLMSASATFAAPSSAPTSKPGEAPATSTYSGHGVSSVSPAVIAQFAAAPLPPEVSRRIQTMLDIRSPSGGILTPDGRTMFFNWGVTGSSQVWRLGGPQRFPEQLTGGEDRTLVADVSPDGSFILISRDRNGEENPGLYWMDVHGGELRGLQHKPGVQTFPDFISEDSRYVYFHANDVKPASFIIYRWDLKSQTRESVFSEDGLWSIADHRPDGTLLLRKETGSVTSEYAELPAGSKALKPVIGQGEREEYNVTYGAHPGEFLVSTPKLGNFRRLYRLAEGKLSAITPDVAHDVSAFEIDDARRHVYVTFNEEGYTRLHVLDAKTFKEVKVPGLPSADHVDVASLSRDGRYATLKLDPGNAPPFSLVWDWKLQKLTPWQTPSTPEMDTHRFARATLESYPARDGTKIPMFVRRPAHCAEPCPVVVKFHGGPEGQSVPGFNPGDQLFVDAGFILVEPNVRGSDGYGKAWFHSDDGPKRLNVITDIEDCSRYIRANWGKGGKAPKVGIYGGSYGGYSTLVGMTMFAGAYDAGASIVGMSNLVTFLENTAPYRRILRSTEYGDPVKDRDALIRLSPITYVDRVRAPLLLIQGASDPRVPVGEALQIHQALDAKKIPNTLIIFPDEGHGAAKRSNLAAQLGHAVHFFEQYLKNAAGT